MRETDGDGWAMEPNGELEKLMVMLGIDGMGAADDCERNSLSHGGGGDGIYAFTLSDTSGGETASATGT
jgi:hypothetical protein